MERTRQTSTTDSTPNMPVTRAEANHQGCVCFIIYNNLEHLAENNAERFGREKACMIMHDLSTRKFRILYSTCPSRVSPNEHVAVRMTRRADMVEFFKNSDVRNTLQLKCDELAYGGLEQKQDTVKSLPRPASGNATAATPSAPPLEILPVATTRVEEEVERPVLTPSSSAPVVSVYPAVPRPESVPAKATLEKSTEKSSTPRPESVPVEVALAKKSSNKKSIVCSDVYWAIKAGLSVVKWTSIAVLACLLGYLVFNRSVLADVCGDAIIQLKHERELQTLRLSAEYNEECWKNQWAGVAHPFTWTNKEIKSVHCTVKKQEIELKYTNFTEPTVPAILTRCANPLVSMAVSSVVTVSVAQAALPAAGFACGMISLIYTWGRRHAGPLV